MKTRLMPLALLALTATDMAHAAQRKYQPRVTSMTCGEARYTLTSTCMASEEPMELNECKPQTLAVERAGIIRRATLPEMPAHESRRIRESGGTLGDLFVVHWACSPTSKGPMATFYYSIGGGRAEYGESWTHYDKAGRLIEKDDKMTVDEINAVHRNFKPVSSIHPD